MSATSSPRTALLLIDIQQGFNDPAHWGTARSTPNFEENIAKLLKAFRQAKNAEVLHVCHHSRFESSPLHPSKPSVNFMDYAAPLQSERVFKKSTNSPFYETDLEKVVKDLKIDRLVIAGLTTGHCVTTTTRAVAELRLVNHSYGCPIKDKDENSSGKIIILEDATAMYGLGHKGKKYDAETVHAIHLATLQDEFCEIGTTDDVIASLDVN